MTYLITFLEGFITFISPCLLPMLPIYLSYFAGEQKRRPLLGALCFIAGFTCVFLLLGLFAGSIGSLLIRYQTAVNIITGLIVVIFGLHFLGLFQLPLFKGMSALSRPAGLFSSFLFGMVFSIAWTPCVGAFLGSALMLASQQASALQGTLLLLCYSLGLGIPFLISALLIQKLTTAFNWIKAHYRVVQLISGGFLLLVGIAMMTGWLNRLLGLLA